VKSIALFFQFVSQLFVMKRNRSYTCSSFGRLGMISRFSPNHVKSDYLYPNRACLENNPENDTRYQAISDIKERKSHV
jgi:hypothetical protein